MSIPKLISVHFHDRSILKKVAVILAIPFYPIYFKIQEVLLNDAREDHIIPVSLLEDAQSYSARFFQVDIGLESHFQLIISISLLLVANSQSKTITGLEVLFDKETFFYMNTKLALALSITWSLISCIRSQIKGISKQRQHSTTISSLLLLLFTSASVLLRVFSSILYLTPAFGLFNSLRHLQGELFPFYDPYLYPEDINDYEFYFGNATPMSWSEVTRWNYISYQKAGGCLRARAQTRRPTLDKSFLLSPLGAGQSI